MWKSVFRADERRGLKKQSKRQGGTLYIFGIMDVDVLLVSLSDPYKNSRFSTIFTDAFASPYFVNIIFLLRPTPVETYFRSHPLPQQIIVLASTNLYIYIYIIYYIYIYIYIYTRTPRHHHTPTAPHQQRNEMKQSLHGFWVIWKDKTLGPIEYSSISVQSLCCL